MQDNRVIKHVVNGVDLYSVHRVSYTDSGEPQTYDSDPFVATETSTEKLLYNLLQMQMALTKPVLDATMFTKKSTSTAIDMVKK